MDKLKFSNQFLYKTVERIIPGAVPMMVLSEHYARYNFSSDLCKNKMVLNVASGCGYGSEILLRNSKEVFNVDISENLVAYGNNKYGNYKNHFIQMDAQNLEFPDNFFDVIVSFETMEHVPDYKKFITECHRVLKNDGLLVLSVPNKNITSPFLNKPLNKFHFKEWKIDELKKEFANFFEITNIYGQNFSKPVIVTGLTSFFIKRESLGLAYKLFPSLLLKFIKKYILKYKEYGIQEILIKDSDMIKKAMEKDFELDKNGMAYSIILLTLKKEN